jgi:hypothetical protein
MGGAQLVSPQTRCSSRPSPSASRANGVSRDAASRSGGREAPAAEGLRHPSPRHASWERVLPPAIRHHIDVPLISLLNW